MPENSELFIELKSLHEKLDRIIFLLENTAARSKSSSPKLPKPKLAPLTQEEIDSHRVKFETLYENWLSGNEAEVQSELEKLDADEIRRFADANNLNVTSKMPKQRVLHLIATRFREKKQLLRNTSLLKDTNIEHQKEYDEEARANSSG